MNPGKLHMIYRSGDKVDRFGANGAGDTHFEGRETKSGERGRAQVTALSLEAI